MTMNAPCPAMVTMLCKNQAADAAWHADSTFVSDKAAMISSIIVLIRGRGSRFGPELHAQYGVLDEEVVLNSTDHSS